MRKIYCVSAMAPNVALKLAIFGSGITQIRIAKQIGIHESRLSRIIRGHDEPSEAEKKAIARVLRRPVTELFPQVAA